MKNKFSEYLSQPAPINDRPWMSVTICIIAVVFILAVFEPFSYRLNSAGQFRVLLGFAFVTLIASSTVFFLFPRLFKEFYCPQKWTVKRNLLNNVVVLLIFGCFVVFYDYVILMQQPTGYFPVIFIIDLFATLTIGIVPLTFITILIQNSALKRNLNNSNEMNQALSVRAKSETDNPLLITFNGSKKESLTIKPTDILYMEASGNYVNIHYFQDNKVTSKLLRTTIKQIEEEIQDQPGFFRCHRAFIININQITKVSGNAQGYKLAFSGTTDEVPVSRTYLKALKDIL